MPRSAYFNFWQGNLAGKALFGHWLRVFARFGEQQHRPNKRMRLNFTAM